MAPAIATPLTTGTNSAAASDTFLIDDRRDTLTPFMQRNPTPTSCEDSTDGPLEDDRIHQLNARIFLDGWHVTSCRSSDPQGSELRRNAEVGLLR
jgi:hypothetical protein